MLHLRFSVLPFAGILAAAIPPALPGGEGKAESNRPPLEKLLKLNERAIFGGTFTYQGDDRFEVLFDASGRMSRGFETQGAPIIDEESPLAVGANRRFFEGGGKDRKDRRGGRGKKDEDSKPVDGFTALGLAPPAGKPALWTSRFPVGGAVKVSFNFRIPNLLSRQSVFNVRLNVDKKAYLESSFFTKVSKISFGKNLGSAVSPLKEYKGPPPDWFPRNDRDGIPVELSVEDRKFVVRIKNSEVVALDKGTGMTEGKVAFVFSRIAFTIQNLKISGTLDREWCEKEIAALEKAGKLVLRAPEPEKKEEPAGGEAGGATGGEKGEGGEGEKKGGEEPEGKKAEKEEDDL